MALLQQVAHTGRVVFVHLAAMGLDVQFFAHRASGAVNSPKLFYAIKKGSELYRDRRAKHSGVPGGKVLEAGILRPWW
jgi:hypothetical protein